MMREPEKRAKVSLSTTINPMDTVPELRLELLHEFGIAARWRPGQVDNHGPAPAAALHIVALHGDIERRFMMVMTAAGSFRHFDAAGGSIANPQIAPADRIRRFAAI